jgi:hypothetical protein
VLTLPVEAAKAVKEASKAISSAIALLPNAQQRAFTEYLKLEQKYEEECTRADSDMDDMLAWRATINLMRSSLIGQITVKSKK